MSRLKLKPYDPHTAVVFTTGQVAELVMVSFQTVNREFDAKRLAGFVIPGSRARRVPRAALVRYCRERGFTHALEAMGERVEVLESKPTENVDGNEGRAEEGEARPVHAGQAGERSVGGGD